MKNTATTLHPNRATTQRAKKAEKEQAVTPSAPSCFASTDLRRAVRTWLDDGASQGWSRRTLTDRRQAIERFCWWLEHEQDTAPTLAALTPTLIRAYLSYARGPVNGGRYGCDHPGSRREARPSTVATYYRVLRAFASFCVEEGLFADTPLRNVRSPRVPVDQIQPFEPQQVQLLLDAARRGRAPERDCALLLMLVDSGMRVSELCGMNLGDVDRGTGELRVTGKGNKRRRVYMGMTARKALWRYLEKQRRDALQEEPLFVSVGGHDTGGAMTPSGVRQIMKKAGTAAGLSGVRCSPHTLRHTFAVNFLRGGGNLFQLQQLMGHTDLTVLRRYVALADADLAAAHRLASPADRLKLR